MSETVCRTCLQVINDPSDVYNLSSKEPNSDLLTLGRKLSECVPELMEISTLSLVLCWSCTTAVRCAYGFRQQCLETEERIKNYILQINGEILTDLRQVIDSASGVNQLSDNIEQTMEKEFIEINDNIIYNSQAEFVQEVINNSSFQNNLFLESFHNVGKESELKENCEANNSYNLMQVNREHDTGQTQLKQVRSPPSSKKPTVSAMSSPILLKELLENRLYICPRCNYKTRKNSKYELHRRIHSFHTKGHHIV